MKAVMFPGQGSQFKGMGKDLFERYPNETHLASEILGYDLKELCLVDSKRVLNQTQFTQPALFVVNAFAYYEQIHEAKPDFLIGHSLGEYNALHAAGAFDFETGVRLVKKRGELMAASSGGSMAAVIGLNTVKLKEILHNGNYEKLDIANYNSPKQVVIAGPQSEIDRFIKEHNRDAVKVVPLAVTAPFHSRYMEPASHRFADFLKDIRFSALLVPVIANTTAEPYQSHLIGKTLSQQITSSVRWVDSVRWLIQSGVADFGEVNSAILTKMVVDIRKDYQDNMSINPPVNYTKENREAVGKQSNSPLVDMPVRAIEKGFDAGNLGSEAFRKAYKLKYAYAAGAMYRGIASKELVIRMSKAGMLSFFGSGGLSVPDIEQNIQSIQRELGSDQPYGMNLLYSLNDKTIEMDTVKLYLNYGIVNVEAAAYMQVTLPLIYFRVKGLSKGNDGEIRCLHKVIAKVSRPEVADAFMRPAPERMIDKLLEQGLITQEQALLAKQVPVSHDICVEADSGGHTDGGNAMVLLPSIQSLRSAIQSQYRFKELIRIGLAGGIGTPQSVACAFVMGADFVTTGSINQCTVEANISDAVKDILQDINVQDTDYAPAGDMFEIGAQIQVLKKGVLFPARANKLFALYQRYDSLDELPEKIKSQLEVSYFKKSLEDVWLQTKQYLIQKGRRAEADAAEQNPKAKMALVFRAYFHYTSSLAVAGNLQEKVNFQVHTGPALGSFNQSVKGTSLEKWQNRHADIIGLKLLNEAANILNEIKGSHEQKNRHSSVGVLPEAL